MRKTLFLPVLILLVAAPIVSCNHEDPIIDDHVIPPRGYKTLNGPRDNVLFNLQKAYSERNIDRYSELLDEGFLFHFSQKDIDTGVIDHSPWDRTEELAANRNMFNPNFTKPDVDPVSDIDLALMYPADDSTWTPIPPEDHPGYPGETWYKKTVAYRLSIQAGYVTFSGNDILASFMVRQATVEGYENPIWRIVAWQDDAGAGFAAPLAGRLRNGLTEETTWGQVKALYGG